MTQRDRIELLEKRLKHKEKLVTLLEANIEQQAEEEKRLRNLIAVKTYRIQELESVLQYHKPIEVLTPQN